MTVHFICRGNAFRSRMAEAYFNSLERAGTHAISSGSVADLHSEANTHNFLLTQSVLEEHGLGSYAKSHWDQLTQDRLNEHDITICLSESVKEECDRLFKMPHNTIVWNVPDFDEIGPVPATERELHDYAERTFLLIAEQVQKLKVNPS